jgi:hypothetical protein
MLDLRATDIRDKVYAVLGICRNDDVSEITVDYAEPVLSLSRRLSHFLIDRGQADVLLYNLASFEKSRISSWMIDLEIGRQSDALKGKASLAPPLLTETPEFSSKWSFRSRDFMERELRLSCGHGQRPQRGDSPVRTLSVNENFN